jgi:SAM-dependent methyltransferase
MALHAVQGGRGGHGRLTYDRVVARYDSIAAWYDDFRPSLNLAERDALERLLTAGAGRCLDLGCGTGIAAPVLSALGWSVIGVDASEGLLQLARGRGVEVVRGSVDALPFPDASFDAAVSLWTHTDVGDFGAALTEVARVLRPGGPFVYIGAHPCFVGPHSRFVAAEGVPELHPGYLQAGRYGTEAPGVGRDGLRAKVGGVHLPLGAFVRSFLDAGLALERFEELENRPYPFTIALRCRR